MKQHLRFGISAVLAGMLCGLASCEKEAITTQSTTEHGYLHFSNSESLKQVVKQISKSKDKRATLGSLRQSAELMTTIGHFRSLSAIKDSLRHNAFNRNSASLVPNATSSSTSTDPAEAFDELVPDISFATVLNEDLQLEVGDQFYQITPEGTYSTAAFNRDALIAMLADTTADLSDHSDEIKEGDYLYRVTEDVYRYDTYAEAETHSTDLDPVILGDGEAGPPQLDPNMTPPFPLSSCGVSQPSSTVGNALPNSVYCTFPTYGYGSHTVVGGWIQGMFGVNSDRTENFDSDHRIKVKLYNFNYGVYASIGLKAKFQKKGWTGIWDKRDCEKLVLGWDAMIFEVPQVFSRPIPYSSPPLPGGTIGRIVTKELFEFVNFSVTANTISQLDPVILGHDFLSSADVVSKLKNLSTNSVANVTNTLWRYAENQLAPNEVLFRNSVTKGFRMIFPDKFVLAFSRWETTKDNDGEIDCLFDMNTCRVTYQGPIQGDMNFGNNVLKPTYSNQAYSYTLKKASVYGAARYNNQWKGIRIIQE